MIIVLRNFAKLIILLVFSIAYKQKHSNFVPIITTIVKMSINKDLFITFLKIGGFTIGGGMAMLPVMEQDVVNKKKWLEKPEFLDIVAVCQALPGIFAVDMASHIGYKLNGIRGAIAATLGTILPSLVVILFIAFFFSAFKDNYWVEAAFRGMRPAVVALISMPVFTMSRSAKLNRKTVWIAIASALLIWLLGVSPAWIILAAALGGLLRGLHLMKEGKK